MTDLEKSFPAGQDETSSEKDMNIYEEYIIPTNVSSLGENQDGKEVESDVIPAKSASYVCL